MNIRNLIITLNFAAALPSSLEAAIALNFGGISNPAFGTAGNLTQAYPGVAPGINASLTVSSSYAALNPTNNGSVLGDVRVNAPNLSSLNLTLELWDSTSGTGYSTPYNPGVAYSIAYGFFDIDGGAGTYDVVTVYTPGFYTVTATTALLISTGGGGVSFSGISSAEIPGQGGITSLTAAQADVAAIYTVNSVNTLVFNYSVGVYATPVATGRNLLLDGDDLASQLDTYGPVTTEFVPEPGAALMVLLGAAQAMRRRR